MGVELPEAVAQAPRAEAERRYDAQLVEAESTLAVVRVLREICGSGLHPVLTARVGFLAASLSAVVVVRPPVFCSSW